MQYLTQRLIDSQIEECASTNTVDLIEQCATYVPSIWKCVTSAALI